MNYKYGHKNNQNTNPKDELVLYDGKPKKIGEWTDDEGNVRGPIDPETQEELDLGYETRTVETNVLMGARLG